MLILSAVYFISRKILIKSQGISVKYQNVKIRHLACAKLKCKAFSSLGRDVENIFARNIRSSIFILQGRCSTIIVETPRIKPTASYKWKKNKSIKMLLS